jgi:acyl-coenzyme A thioesterase PaaI-like protein
MPGPFDYPVVDLAPEAIAADLESYGALAASVRALGEASLRTTLDADAVARIRGQIEELTCQLRAGQHEGSLGVRVVRGGPVLAWGNAVVGARNPIAVPLHIEQDPTGRSRASFHLNALYEGPPTLVHGGVTALILDQMLGEAAAAGGAPGMTGQLTLRYLRPTPLGDCSAEAWIDHREGVKTIVKGAMRNADGEDTVTAEGIFILPRWARERRSTDDAAPNRFE